MRRALRYLVVLLIAVIALPAAAQFKLFGQGDELLEPEKAFQFAARAVDSRTLEVSFTIAEGYYMYRDKFRFALEGADGVALGAPQLPPGIRKKDEFFGEVEIYRKSVSVQLPLERSNTAAQTVKLNVTSQGCADIGVCYTPMDSSATLQLAALSASDAGGAGGAPVLSEAPRAVEPSASFSIFASDLDIAKLFEGNLFIVLLSFLGFGLLLAFTPCVLPMVPILSGIIAGEGRSLNKARAFLLSLAYVLGMAVTYAAAGVAAAYSGTLLAAALQNAWVLGAFALVFVVARALDVRLLRTAAARLPASSPAFGAPPPRGREDRVGRGDGRVLGDHRQPLRRRAAGRRAALHLADQGRGARRRSAVRRWRSAWACRSLRSAFPKARCCRNRAPGWRA